MSSLRPLSGTAAEILALLRAWEAAEVEPEPLVVATSGSSGEPKRVLLSRRALRAAADAVHTRLGGPGQWVLNLPPTYVAGLQVLVRSVLAGTDPVLQTGDLAEAAERLSAERRYVSVVPTRLRRLLEEPSQAEALRSFTTVLVGGAAVPAELRSRAEEVGVSVVATYGMSETGGGCVYDGEPLAGVGLSLTDQGRIRLRGPMLFDGYDGDPRRTAEVLADGWFTTSDLGELGGDGRLRVLGRVDDVVVSGGVNVPAPAVAERLRSHRGVREVQVVGAPDPEWGERVVAVVVGEISLGEARDWVAQRLPRAWAPRELRLLPELPLLANGKVDRVALRAAPPSRDGAGGGAAR